MYGCVMVYMLNDMITIVKLTNNRHYWLIPFKEYTKIKLSSCNFFWFFLCLQMNSKWVHSLISSLCEIRSTEQGFPFSPFRLRRWHKIIDSGFSFFFLYFTSLIHKTFIVHQFYKNGQQKNKKIIATIITKRLLLYAIQSCFLRLLRHFKK